MRILYDCLSMVEWDDKVMAPLHGFVDGMAYYHQMSPAVDQRLSTGLKVLNTEYLMLIQCEHLIETRPSHLDDAGPDTGVQLAG